MTHPLNGYLAYLATPYTKYKPDPTAAFVCAAKLSAKLLCAGIKVYSPIVHCQPIGFYGGLDLLDHTIWLPFDEAMMAKADVLIVAQMDGWEASKGVAYETAFFMRANKPIYDLDPSTLTMRRRAEAA